MTRFHINSKGDPGPCSASNGRCPFGGADGSENHFDSMEEAAVAVMEASFEKESTATGTEVEGDHPCTICGTMVGNPWDAWCDPCAKREFNLYLTEGKYR